MSDLKRVTAWTTEQVGELVASIGFQPRHLAYLASGHWSDCFGFVHNTQDLVVRFGRQGQDFRKDELASRFGNAALPIPSVLSMGEANGDFYIVSERVRGVALEQVPNWSATNNAVADLLEGLRQVDVSSITGWGFWTSTSAASAPNWRAFLLTINQDDPASRVHGWRAALAQRPIAQAAFDRGYELLDATARDDVPRALVHNDLYHRNVHVSEGVITGVFDWGNSIIGDHLYDLAMLCFWSPWFDHLDDQRVLGHLHRRWDAIGATPINFDERFLTCMLHMALEHIAYHAFLGNDGEMLRVCRRMDQVIELSWR